MNPRAQKAAATLRQRRRNAAPIRVSGFLTSEGFDPEFIAKFGSPFGKHVAKAYRAQHGGRDAKRGRKLINGRHRRVFVYRPGDPALTIAMSTYKRTRDHFTTAA